MKIENTMGAILLDEASLRFTVKAEGESWSWEEGYRPYFLSGEERITNGNISTGGDIHKSGIRRAVVELSRYLMSKLFNDNIGSGYGNVSRVIVIFGLRLVCYRCENSTGDSKHGFVNRISKCSRYLFEIPNNGVKNVSGTVNDKAICLC